MATVSEQRSDVEVIEELLECAKNAKELEELSHTAKEKVKDLCHDGCQCFTELSNCIREIGGGPIPYEFQRQLIVMQKKWEMFTKTVKRYEEVTGCQDIQRLKDLKTLSKDDRGLAKDFVEDCDTSLEYCLEDFNAFVVVFYEICDALVKLEWPEVHVVKNMTSDSIKHEINLKFVSSATERFQQKCKSLKNATLKNTKGLWTGLQTFFQSHSQETGDSKNASGRPNAADSTPNRENLPDNEISSTCRESQDDDDHGNLMCTLIPPSSDQSSTQETVDKREGTAKGAASTPDDANVPVVQMPSRTSKDYSDKDNESVDEEGYDKLNELNTHSEETTQDTSNRPNSERPKVPKLSNSNTETSSSDETYRKGPSSKYTDSEDRFKEIQKRYKNVCNGKCPELMGLSDFLLEEQKRIKGILNH